MTELHQSPDKECRVAYINVTEKTKPESFKKKGLSRMIGDEKECSLNATSWNAQPERNMVIHASAAIPSFSGSISGAVLARTSNTSSRS